MYIPLINDMEQIDTKVENINMEHIEDHFRLKDLQRHKAKLLELLDKEDKEDIDREFNGLNHLF